MTIKVLACLAGLASLAAAATRTEMLVSTDWLAQHLNDPKLVILHVAANRTAYDAGHVPGARFLSQSEFVVARNGVPNELPPAADLQRALESVGVSDDTRVILYSDSSVLPATRAYFTLDYLGHGDHAALLDGGLEKWKSEGRAISKDAPATAQGHLTPKIKVQLVVSMDEVKDLSAKAASKTSPALLDVRAAADYQGEKGSHIPGALNVYWMEDQVSKESQALKPESDLRKLYEAAGLAPNRTVVTYCNSGMQATESYFTLKYLGYDVRLYDGSMSEWKAKDGPVEK